MCAKPATACASRCTSDSSASWLEDQDFFRFSGIFRPVFLYAKPRTHIEDLWLRAGLAADNATGTLAPRLKTSCADPPAPKPAPSIAA